MIIPSRMAVFNLVLGGFFMSPTFLYMLFPMLWTGLLMVCVQIAIISSLLVALYFGHDYLFSVAKSGLEVYFGSWKKKPISVKR